VEEKLYSPESNTTTTPLPATKQQQQQSEEPEKKSSVERDRKLGSTAVADAYKVNTKE
jgi:hypothetical protein